MKTYTPEELQAILTLHAKWLNSEPGGQRADLYNADLRSANLYNADLRSANLYNANLRSADLQSADLYNADLRSANLYNANLRSADLRSANLRSANLYNADLYNADLRSANLYNAKYSDNEILLQYFTIGPIGSRNDYLQIFQTDVTTHIKTGCFNGTLPEFNEAVTNKHGDNKHAVAYRAAINLITIVVQPCPN